MAIKTVGVIGAGSMGSGIANVFALNGYNVVLRDIEERFVQGGFSRIDKFMSKSVQKGKMTEEAKQEVLSRITLTTDLQDLKDVDLVVEAVLEDMDLKQSVFSQLDEIVREDVILTTNIIMHDDLQQNVQTVWLGYTSSTQHK